MNASMWTAERARELTNAQLLGRFEQVAGDQREQDCTESLRVLREELRQRLSRGSTSQHCKART
jgi:hypothetical protein